MNAVVQNFIGTTEEWETENPILYEAVWGFEKTTEGKLLAKVGDGVSSWNDLNYFDDDQSRKIKEIETALSEKSEKIIELGTIIKEIKILLSEKSESEKPEIPTDEIEPEQEEKIDEDDITDEDMNDNEPDDDESNDNQEIEE